ncbi:hypothetical protein [Haloterrigena sp. H1]|nr:hypothetical protein [Haloterrigena sp. H1]
MPLVSIVTIADRTLEGYLVAQHTPLEVAHQLAAVHERGGTRLVSE